MVVIDHAYCIGCQYCVQACPYGARYFNEEKGVTDKCTWCYHRITKGLNPACVEVCPVGARIFGDRNDKESPISVFLRNNRVSVLSPSPAMRPTFSTSVSIKRLSDGNALSCRALYRLGLSERNGDCVDRAIVVYPYITGLVAGAFTVSSLYQCSVSSASSRSHTLPC